MKGYVDDSLRTLLDVMIRSQPGEEGRSVTTWVDSAFNGYLVLPQSLIDELDLRQEAATEAILADGSIVTLESFLCFVDWCGRVVAAQVIANDGRFPLLGTELLKSCVLLINYQEMMVTVTR